jgi:hypothetical protein
MHPNTINEKKKNQIYSFHLPAFTGLSADLGIELDYIRTIYQREQFCRIDNEQAGGRVSLPLVRSKDRHPQLLAFSSSRHPTTLHLTSSPTKQ